MFPQRKAVVGAVTRSVAAMLAVPLLMILLYRPPLEAATLLGAYATVRVPLLNVRTGPGADFELLDTARAGETIPVIGRLPDCSWLHVVRPGKGEGWVSATLVVLSSPCLALPAVERTAPLPARLVSPTLVPAPVTCSGLPNESYGSLTISGSPTDRPAATHPDLNLSLRGYQAGPAQAQLVHNDGPVDERAPQLWGLFADQRRATIIATYQVFDWNWGCDCRGGPLDTPPATLLALATTPGEPIYTPDSPRTIGSGYEALVLHATGDAITLKFTREDNVVRGYTLHVQGICVEPSLLALYTARDAAGRGELPALRGGQPFGRAQGDVIEVAIRDNGQFMDARARNHWWR